MSSSTLPPLSINGHQVPTGLVNDFLAENGRATSFITNFGNWRLPAAVAAAMDSPVGHLEWFHDTGELVLVGAVPHRGEGSAELSNGEADVIEAEELLTPGGAPGHVEHCADGVTREHVPEMVVPVDTQMAVLAVIPHGPKVHEVLWGWHREHRDPGGWAWLEGRLATLT